MILWREGQKDEKKNRRTTTVMYPMISGGSDDPKFFGDVRWGRVVIDDKAV